jgi:lysophospholipase L1-like esterase
MNRYALLSFAALLPVAFCRSAFGAEPAEHNYAKWEKEIAAFERSDAVTPPPKGALLFLGSSTIRLWKTLASDFPQAPVINRGFGGSQIVDATYFAPRIIFPYAPRAIYLRSGGNDLWAGKSVEQVFGDFKAFVATVHAKLPDTDIVYISLSPSIARWKQADMTKSLNALVADFIKGKAHLRYIETYDIALGPDGQPRPELFAKDKLHFSPEGYTLLAARVRPDLQNSAPPKGVK